VSKLVRTLLGILLLGGIMSAGGDFGILGILIGLLIVAQLFFD